MLAGNEAVDGAQQLKKDLSVVFEQLQTNRAIMLETSYQFEMDLAG
jgi:hypothetical protein